MARHLLDDSCTHPPVTSPAVVVIGGLHVGSVGLTTHSAAQAGLEPWAVSRTGLDRSVYFPGAHDIHINLVGDGEGRLVGAQAVGHCDVKERMNLLALVLSEGVSATRLVGVERAYSPPAQLLVDPMLPLLEEFIEGVHALQDDDQT